MDNKNKKFKHILFATDFSEYAKEACLYAKSLSDKYDAEISLLHVIKEELPDMLIFDAGNERTPAGVTNRLTIQKNYTEEQIKKMEATIRDKYKYSEKSIKKIIVRKGKPSKTILNVSDEIDCDLIVMGIKGESSLGDILMGDTVRKVITKSKVPVLVV